MPHPTIILMECMPRAGFRYPNAARLCRRDTHDRALARALQDAGFPRTKQGVRQAMREFLQACQIVLGMDDSLDGTKTLWEMFEEVKDHVNWISEITTSVVIDLFFALVKARETWFEQPTYVTVESEMAKDVDQALKATNGSGWLWAEYTVVDLSVEICEK